MALKYQPLCKACNIIKEEKGGNKVSDSRLYRYMEDHKLRLKTAAHIIDKYPVLSVLNIYTHARKHQTVAETRVQRANIKEATLDELKTEVVALTKRMSTLEQTKTDTSKLIAMLMQKAESGEIQGRFGDLVKLLGQESKIHEKEADQGIQMLGLMSKYQSGELKQNREPDAS